MGEKLKPCPFCGSENIIIEQTEIGTDMNVRCSDCSANIDVKSWKVFSNIIKTWNKRAKI